MEININTKFNIRDTIYYWWESYRYNSNEKTYLVSSVILKGTIDLILLDVFKNNKINIYYILGDTRICEASAYPSYEAALDAMPKR